MHFHAVLDSLAQDLRYALRALRRHRGLSAVIVLTLGLAIGANTAIFSLMDALLLRALPARDPQSLLLVRWSARTAPAFQNWSSYGDCDEQAGNVNLSSCSFSLPFFRALQRQAADLSTLTAQGGSSIYNLSGHGPAATTRAQVVAGNYFSTLGVEPELGRMLTPADDTPAAAPALVLSYTYWQSAFGGARDAVGKTIELNHVPVTIVGVADRRFPGLTPGRVFDGWLPLALRPRLAPGWTPESDGPDAVWLVLVGRLRPGVKLAAAQAEVNGLFRNAMLHGSTPLAKPAAAPAATLVPAQSAIEGARQEYSQPLFLLMWTVGAILLIACANIAGLLLGRARARDKELALRRALGAGGGRILRQLLTESLLLASLGGALGLGLAVLGAHALLAMLASSSTRPLGIEFALDARVLLFTLAVALCTGVLFGLAPAVRGARLDLNRSLKDGVGNSAPTANRRLGFGLNWGNGLAVAQIALCMVVLSGAGLLVRTLQNLRNVDPGFATNNLLLFDLEPVTVGYKGAAVIRLYDQLQQRIAALPGVRAVSYSDSPLLAGDLSMTSWKRGGKGPDENADILAVGSNFFQTMHMRLLLGRELASTDFTPESDTPPPPPNAKSTPPPPTAALVNQSLARQYLAPGDPIGQQFGDPSRGRETWRVVGVVADAKYQGLRDKIVPTIYVPNNGGYASFEVRTATPPLALLPAVRRAVGAVDPNLPLIAPTTQTEAIDRVLFQERLLAQLSTIFAGLALLLACIGLYGLLAQEVARRTREIGIRMALGAERGHVLGMVISNGAVLAAVGIAIGAAGAWGLTRYLRSMLYGVSPNDPFTLAAVGGLLLAVALAACSLPARRAMRVDPLVALREE